MINKKRFKKKYIPWNKNKKTGPQTKEHKEKIGIANKGKLLGNKNPNWKGTNAAYRSIHEWVQNHLGSPNTCKKCKKTNLKAQQIHWANISGRYIRKLKDWIRLCVKCHKAFDKNRKTLYKHYDKNKKRIIK